MRRLPPADRGVRLAPIRRGRLPTLYLRSVARTWILHTETKGTGAQMVPLESTTKRSPPESLVVPPTPRPRRRPPDVRPREAHRFRIVDVMTRETLADGASTAEAVAVLRGVRSSVDINVYVWREQQGRWRLLTLEEKRMLWDLRDA
jgi:hypothetical protein